VALLSHNEQLHNILQQQLETKNNGMNGTEKQSTWVNPTVGIAVGSVLSYCYAYAYEKGFCDVFGIPVELIRLDIARVLIVGGLLIGVVWFCIAIFNLLPRSVFDKKVSRWLRILAALPFVAIVILISWDSPDWALVYLLTFSLLVFSYLHLGGAFELRTDNPLSFVSRLAIRLDRSLIQAAIYALFVMIIINATGRASAARKVDFLVPVDHADIVGLRIYGDTIICAKANLEKREIYPILSFYPVNSDFARSLEVRHLSHMKVLNDPTPR
jgi:hypothetical protein